MSKNTKDGNTNRPAPTSVRLYPETLAVIDKMAGGCWGGDDEPSKSKRINALILAGGGIGQHEIMEILKKYKERG